MSDPIGRRYPPSAVVRPRTRWRQQRRRRVVFSVLIAACALAPPTTAQARDYLIEALIFTQPAIAPTEDSENANAQPSANDFFMTDGDVEIWANDRHLGEDKTAGTSSVEPEYFQPVFLTNAAAALKRRAGFNILGHIAWRQPGGTRRRESPLIVLPAEGSAVPLSGTLRVFANTYIFAEIDLSVEGAPVMARARQIRLPDKPVTDGTATAGSLLENVQIAPANADSAETLPAPVPELSNIPYRLKERRRVKFKKVHYFDHPRIGVILTVQPIESDA